MSFINLPEKLLADHYFHLVNQPKLIIITGESGVGKTTACQHLIRHAQQQGCLVAGLVSPPVYRSGRKVAIDLTNIFNGETRRFATTRERIRSEDKTSLSTMDWDFDPTVIAWGNQILDSLPSSPLLILDELGPLEFTKGTGFTSGLQLLDEQLHQTACVVIRSACLSIALERWPWAQVVDDLPKRSAGVAQ